MPSAWNPLSGVAIEGEGTIYNSSFEQAIGYFGGYNLADYGWVNSGFSSPFYTFSAQTGYGGGDTSLSSDSNAGYGGGGGYQDTGSGLGGGPSLESLDPGWMNAVPDSLIFNPDAVPTSPGFSLEIASSENFIPITYSGPAPSPFSPDLSQGVNRGPWNPFPDGAPPSWVLPLGNMFAGGLIGAHNRARFFGLMSDYGEKWQITSDLPFPFYDPFDPGATLGGPDAPTWMLYTSPAPLQPNYSAGPRMFPPIPNGMQQQAPPLDPYRGPPPNQIPHENGPPGFSPWILFE